jgi:catechol 2,3-dioxygenase-like lactoylglutathione lyase family enzyme
MDADADGHAQRPKISAGVAACLIRVCDLDRSLKFYCDVFSCRVALRQATWHCYWRPAALSSISTHTNGLGGAGALGVRY